MLPGPVNTGPVPGTNGREARGERRKSGAASGTGGSTRKTDRSEIRCGERAERDHPREAREPEADTEAAHLGQPWGEEPEEVGRNGPEEIRAATQRRLLGAFCCLGCCLACPGAAEVAAHESVRLSARDVADRRAQ
jgi:hypothetical protein